MIRQLFATNNESTGLILRLTLGLVMFPHGAQKLLGLFGGYGFKGTMGYFTNTLHLPALLAFLVIMVEFFGPLLLIAGFATRIAAALLIILMIGIFITGPHLQNGFFMNWTGQQLGEGYEYHLLVIGIALALLFSGGGRYAADHLIAK
jgi:putative oxidoreductase